MADARTEEPPPEEDDDEDDNQDTYGFSAKPKFPFNPETEEAVLDLRALYQIPFNTLEDGISALRVMIFPKGKCLHVPGQAGKYLVSGSWRSQYAISVVHFNAASKRPPELLLSFIDYGMLNSASSGIFVETLQLPLQKARHVFEDTPRISKIADVIGFTDINAAAAPWNSQLAIALAKQPVLKRMDITKQSDIQKQYLQRLEKRITVCVQETRESMLAAVEDLRRQDARAADKQLAAFEATLEHTIGALKALPPSAYDTTLGGRIMTLKEGEQDDTPAGFPSLTSPLRMQVTGGTASLIRTQLAVRHRDPTDKQAPSKKRIFEEPPPVELSDDDGDNSNDDDDDNTAEATGEGGSAGANVNGKRQRRAPNRMEPAAVPKKRKPAAVKAKGPAGAAKDDPTLNERTRQPYVRGPYAKEKTPKDGEKKVDRKAPGPHVDKNQLGESLAASKLQAAEINSLKMQLTFAKEQQETLKSNQA